jgi:hypothetical protein
MTMVRVQVQLREPTRPAPPPQPIRIARLLAQAHRLEQEVRRGGTDLAGIARRYGLTRARVTQLLNMTLLAPAIQADVARLTTSAQVRDRIKERAMRSMTRESSWTRQLARWQRQCR